MASDDLLIYAFPVALAVLVLWVWTTRAKSVVERLPLPPGAEMIWGHEKIVFTQQPGRPFKIWTDKVGLTYRIKAALGAKDLLVLNDPVGIAHILQKRIFDYHHSEIVRPRAGRLLGHSLAWVEGEAEHKRMRQLIKPSLTAENVRGMSDEIREAVLQVIDDLINHVQAREEKTAINIVEWTGRATLNVIGRAAFLHDFQGGNSEEAQRIKDARQHGVSPVLRYAGFITAMLLRRFPVLNKLPIPALQAQSLARTLIQSEVAREMIRRNEDVVDRKVRQHRDLLSKLLVARAEGRIGEQELYDHISTFLITGFDSTTHTLALTLWELARNPDVQTRLRAELVAFPHEPTFDDFQTRLPFLDAVLKETLRLYPVLPAVERVATKADVIPLRHPVRLSDGRVVSEIPVNPKQVVVIPTLALQRSEAVWTDAEVFRPERWLGDLPPKALLVSGWANLLAFSDGPRTCVGIQLAIFQYKMIVTHLLKTFEFRATGERLTFKVATALHAFVAGEEHRGPRVPVHVEIL